MARLQSHVKRGTSLAIAMVAAMLYLRCLTPLLVLPWFVHDILVYFPMLGYSAVLVSLLALRRLVAEPTIWSLILIPLLCIGFHRDCHFGRVQTGNVAGHPLKLLTFNIANGAWADDKILELIEAESPDVLFLQEMPERFWIRYQERLRSRFAHCEFYEKIFVATKLSVQKTRKVHLSNRRRLLVLTVQHEGQPFVIANTHLRSLRARLLIERVQEQRDQISAVQRIVEADGLPVVLGGDFNFPSDSTCYRQLRASYHDGADSDHRGFAYTWPSLLPFTAIDHVFGNDGIRFLSYRTVPVALSDHLPVATAFHLE